MDDAVPVPLEGVTILVLRLREAAAARLFYPHGVVGQHEESLAPSLPHSAFSHQLNPTFDG